MSVPDRHHILAEAYQKQFIATGKCIWVHDKVLGKPSFPTQPKNSTVRTDFNTALLADGSHDKSTMENLFSKFETAYPETVSQLRSGVQTTDSINHAIAFMNIQAARSPLLRRIMADLLLRLTPEDETLMRQLKIDDVGIELLRRARTGDEDAKTKIGLHSTLHVTSGVIAALKDVYYRSIRVSAPISLVSSDNPVTYFSISKRKGKLAADLPLPGQRILCFFPLAKDLLLFGDTQRPPVEQFSQDRLTQSSNSITLVKRLNTLTALTAERNIIAPTDEDLRKTLSSIKNKSPDIKTLLPLYAQLAKAALQVNREHWK